MIELFNLCLEKFLVWLSVGPAGAKAVSMTVRAAVLVLICYLAVRAITHAARLASSRIARSRRGEPGARIQVVTFISNIARYLVWILGIIYFVMILGFNPTPLIAGAGLAGVAIGFGLQSLVRDVVSGLFIMIDQTFTPGDYIEASGIQGVVSHVGLRMVGIRDLNDVRIFVPTGGIGVIRNYPGPFIKVRFIVPLDAEADRDRALEFVDRVTDDIDSDFGALSSGSPEVKLVTDEARTIPAVRVAARLRPGTEAKFRAELSARLKLVFGREQIPWPAGLDVLDVPMKMTD